MEKKISQAYLKKSQKDEILPIFEKINVLLKKVTSKSNIKIGMNR